MDMTAGDDRQNDPNPGPTSINVELSLGGATSNTAFSGDHLGCISRQQDLDTCKAELAMCRTTESTASHVKPTGTSQDAFEGTAERYAWYAHTTFEYKMNMDFFPLLESGEIEWKDDGSCFVRANKLGDAFELARLTFCPLYTAFHRGEREPPLNESERQKRASTVARALFDTTKERRPEKYQKLKRWHFDNPLDRHAFPPPGLGMLFGRFAVWSLRQKESTRLKDEASYDEQLLESLEELMLYYIEHGARMFIRRPRAGEVPSEKAIAEYYGASANFVVKLSDTSTASPQVFVAVLPLFAKGESLATFHLHEIWQRYVEHHMPLCVISREGICTKRQENTGKLSTPCCDFFRYFTLKGGSSKKKRARTLRK